MIGIILLSLYLASVVVSLVTIVGATDSPLWDGSIPLRTRLAATLLVTFVTDPLVSVANGCDWVLDALTGGGCDEGPGTPSPA